MQVYNSGTWANALWWQKVGSNPSASNFVWDFDVQLDDASQTAGQALEFDVFQFLDGYNYMMGTECNYSTGVWDLWDEAAGHWRPTSSPCAKFQPGVWHHVQWYMQRTPGSAALYVCHSRRRWCQLSHEQDLLSQEPGLGSEYRCAISARRER